MATPTVIEIPKTKSAAADPSARSFLTTIPPEIRNRIYECLFKRDGPVILDDGQVHRALWNWDHVIHLTQSGVEQQVRNEDLCDVFAGCTDLLLSCRQVYHEAVGILYCQNTFFFSQFLENQMRFTCTWLSRIGSHYQLLSRVSIDAEPSALIHYREYNLLPLLKLIWNHPQAKCEFAFVHSGSSLSQERNNGAGYHDPITVADLMNRVLFELRTADVLNLRQYAKYSGLISSIKIWFHEHDHFGYVEYNDSNIPHPFPHPGRIFDIPDHGSEIQWKESEQLRLLSLPTEILSAINAYAGASDTNVTFDLDTNKAQGYRIGLSGVNDLLRGDIDHIYTRVYDEIVVRMSTQEARTDFNNFKALQKLLEIENFENLVNGRREEHCFINMTLIFKLSIAKPTADLRININKLLYTFNDDHGTLVITVQEPDSSMKDTQSIRWQHIQTAVFLLLSDVSEQYPSKTDQPFPQIWINGYGTVLCATYPATAISEEKTIPCSYGIDDPADILDQYHRKTEYLDQSGIWENLASSYDIYSYMNNDSLASMWYCLRYFLGRDLEG
ncbi:hypothetical protein J4E83_008323 [Alternaria metachromatica]|uniref:uncharacterized protein n=1 Tax=Alternaria metachromatica TaxID=283354 RepID=UPI0020C5A86B|nr:uncharacterized protein J4E83_008323 [Alternaria metachromatica]KAI4610709.1 hypothetical protein J4E83_008323 [Alternaria metachromatica]